MCTALLASTGFPLLSWIFVLVGERITLVLPHLSIETSKEAVKSYLNNIFRKSLPAALNTPLLSPVPLRLAEDWAATCLVPALSSPWLILCFWNVILKPSPVHWERS